jgi:2'-5' RNA ligase
VAQHAPRARLTWVPPERIHITVRFIGEADEHQARAIAQALEAPLDVTPFDLTVGGVGVFPARGRPRVIWAGVPAGREPVLEMERQVSSRLETVVGPGDERGYSPHVTLARVREADGLTRTICKGLENVVLGTTRVETVTLFESRLSPNGPAYVPLGRYRLGGSPIK